MLRYTVFKTQWGFLGFICTDNAVFRSSLPVEDRHRAQRLLLGNMDGICFEAGLKKNLQEKIKAYFEGSYVDFTKTQAYLGGFSDFSKAVLRACRTIGYGQTMSYKDLAESAHHSRASRVVGNILAQNPLPLIIPCHRVIRSDGQIGGFMGGKLGGTQLKKRLLQLEQSSLQA